MKRYLEPTDEGAFVDFSKLPKPAYMGPAFVECPKCKGHGGWNLELNAYPMHGRGEDTPENRHKFTHFIASCGQCNGYGWTDDIACIHELAHNRNVGKCLNEYKCTKCPHTRVHRTKRGDVSVSTG